MCPNCWHTSCSSSSSTLLSSNDATVCFQNARPRLRKPAIWRKSTWAKTEPGERPLRLNEFLALCRVLGLDPESVVRELDQATASGTTRELLALEAKRRQLDAELVEARLTADRQTERRALTDDKIESLRAAFADEEQFDGDRTEA